MQYIDHLKMLPADLDALCSRAEAAEDADDVRSAVERLVFGPLLAWAVREGVYIERPPAFEVPSIGPGGVCAERVVREALLGALRVDDGAGKGDGGNAGGTISESGLGGVADMEEEGVRGKRGGKGAPAAAASSAAGASSAASSAASGASGAAECRVARLLGRWLQLCATDGEEPFAIAELLAQAREQALLVEVKEESFLAMALGTEGSSRVCGLEAQDGGIEQAGGGSDAGVVANRLQLPGLDEDQQDFGATPEESESEEIDIQPTRLNFSLMSMPSPKRRKLEAAAQKASKKGLLPPEGMSGLMEVEDMEDDGLPPAPPPGGLKNASSPANSALRDALASLLTGAGAAADREDEDAAAAFSTILASALEGWLVHVVFGLFGAVLAAEGARKSTGLLQILAETRAAVLLDAEGAEMWLEKLVDFGLGFFAAPGPSDATRRLVET